MLDVKLLLIKLSPFRVSMDGSGCEHKIEENFKCRKFNTKITALRPMKLTVK
jgi:hypothetical protein